MKQQERGIKVALLDNCPKIGFYEKKIIDASRICQSVSDVIHYSSVIEIKDTEEFIELVFYCKGLNNA